MAAADWPACAAQVRSDREAGNAAVSEAALALKKTGAAIYGDMRTAASNKGNRRSL